MNNLIWTGPLNDEFRIGGRVGLYDTTLRDGEQTVGVVLDPEQKLEIATLLDELGIDRIEAGFPRVSDDDWKAIERIAGAGLRAEIWGFSRAVPADLEALVELEVQYSVIESPISDLKLDAIGVSRESMLERITSAMRFAADHGIHAAFFGVDSSRAQRDFYDTVYSTAVEAGAREVVVAIKKREENIFLSITDDGTGFDPGQVADQKGLGIVGIRERVRLVDGTVSIVSQPEHGTQIEVRVPLTKRMDP